MGRLKPLLVTLVVTGALAGGGAAIASAASSRPPRPPDHKQRLRRAAQRAAPAAPPPRRLLIPAPGTPTGARTTARTCRRRQPRASQRPLRQKRDPAEAPGRVARVGRHLSASQPSLRAYAPEAEWKTRSSPMRRYGAARPAADPPRMGGARAGGSLLLTIAGARLGGGSVSWWFHPRILLRWRAPTVLVLRRHGRARGRMAGARAVSLRRRDCSPRISGRSRCSGACRWFSARPSSVATSTPTLRRGRSRTSA